MPLREHLAELRRRLIISVIAIVLGAVAGWFLYEPLFRELQEPLMEIREERDLEAVVNFNSVMTALNLHLKGAMYIGVVIASPIWLYQIWRFVTPGLTRKERRTSMAFVSVAVPLFLAGVLLAWTVLPRAVRILLEFTPDDAANVINAEDYFNFATRLILAFGIAFVAPLFAVALNMVGILSGEALGRHWRIAVFLCFLFTAMFSPSPDAGTMIIMTLPMVALYVLAVGFCLLNDRRRRRNREADPVFGLSDDEASPLEPAPPAPTGESSGSGGPGLGGSGLDGSGLDGSGQDIAAPGPIEPPAPLDGDRIDGDRR